MKPADYAHVSTMGSVSGKSETETVARNIMVILARTGNVFRPLSWDEYRKERMLDGNFSEKERAHFDCAAKYCESSETAALFCPDWEKVGE